MEERIQLSNTTSRRMGEKAVRLSDITTQLLETRISPQQAKFGRAIDAWRQLLPLELQRHCKIAGVSGGLLKVTADSPAYVYELQLCSTELIEQLRRQCPGARIEKIKVSLGSVNLPPG